MNTPANTSGTSKFALAIIIMVPMPRFDATVSEMTEPTNANVIATFSDAKKYGIVRGSPTFHRMSNLVAFSAFMTSSSSGSVVASPVATLTTTGNRHVISAVMTAGTVPEPKYRTKIGTTATFGTDEKPISSGYATS